MISVLDTEREENIRERAQHLHVAVKQSFAFKCFVLLRGWKRNANFHPLLGVPPVRDERKDCPL